MVINAFDYFLVTGFGITNVGDNRLPPFLFLGCGTSGTVAGAASEFVHGCFTWGSVNAIVAAHHIGEGGVVTVAFGLVRAFAAGVRCSLAKAVCPTVVDANASGMASGVVLFVTSGRSLRVGFGGYDGVGVTRIAAGSFAAHQRAQYAGCALSVGRTRPARGQSDNLHLEIGRAHV